MAAGREVRVVDAARAGDTATVRALIAQRALHWAGDRDDVGRAELLIRAGANVNAANDLGVTPLWAACENGSAAMTRRLLRAGADPNAALLSGETPLMTAARTGAASVVTELLAKGARANAREHSRDQTALMWAVGQRHPDVVALLLAAGADVRARTKVDREW